VLPLASRTCTRAVVLMCLPRSSPAAGASGWPAR
jgi:hypothetical protein